MKKQLMISASLLCSTLLYGQGPITLTFDQHAIKSESDNEMHICRYANPGDKGANVIWDFSGLTLSHDFKGLVNSAYHSTNTLTFPLANTELVEFGYKFYFNISNNKVEQIGFSDASDNYRYHYRNPFLKMEYPFTYGTHYQGDYDGFEIVSGQEQAIAGRYEVLGDAFGKLILPGNVIYENTLRVKTVKSFNRLTENNPYTYETTTYRWYIGNHRYPVLVLSETRNSSSVHHLAAYNNKVTEAPVTMDNSDNSGLMVFPVPASDKVTVAFTMKTDSEVSVDLFDLTGKWVLNLLKANLTEGTHEETLQINGLGIARGTYLLRVNLGAEALSREIVLF